MNLGRYMTAEPVGDEWAIYDRHGGLLATVEWYARWRCYVVSPDVGAVFSADCLRELAAFCDARTQARSPSARRGRVLENNP